MPVTRDLSKAKREMILEWLNGNHLYDKDKEGEKPPDSDCVHKCAQNFVLMSDKELNIDPPKLPESCNYGIVLLTYPVDTLSTSVASVADYISLELLMDTQEKQNCMNVDFAKMSSKVPASYTIEDLHCLLQTAIRLEFSTIPPYLTALFSIIDGHNREAAKLIRSVVMQEMLHMAQAANLLIATGGNPVINSPDFVPRYPGRLPGGVLPGLMVHLGRATKTHIHRNFMAIEYPRESNVGVNQTHTKTIGQFYTLIGKVMDVLYGQTELSCNDKCVEKQVKWPTDKQDAYGGTLHTVKDLKSAKIAIKEIMDQGEGVGPFDPSGGGGELAHYYKFEEIVCGRKLKEAKKGLYTFSGDEITLDETGVYPMRQDPTISNLQPHTTAYHFSKIFSEVYRQLLNRMHQTFNGHPDGFRDSVSIMWSLKMYAKKLMKMKMPVDGDKHTVGPSWEL